MQNIATYVSAKISTGIKSDRSVGRRFGPYGRSTESAMIAGASVVPEAVVVVGWRGFLGAPLMWGWAWINQNRKPDEHNRASKSMMVIIDWLGQMEIKSDGLVRRWRCLEHWAAAFVAGGGDRCKMANYRTTVVAKLSIVPVSLRWSHCRPLPKKGRGAKDITLDAKWNRTKIVKL